MTMDDALLANAKRWMGKLPRDQFDMLLALVLDARKVERAIGFRAGQSHAAGLLEALEDIIEQSAIGNFDATEIARAAIAAAKGADR